jgi:hypothetical protein
MNGFRLVPGRFAAVAWAAGLFAGASPAGEQGTGAKTEEAKEFAGKLLLVGTPGAPAGGWLVEGVRTRVLGGKSFLVGKIARRGEVDEPVAGRTVWIATDHLTHVVEFKTLDEARKASLTWCPSPAFFDGTKARNVGRLEKPVRSPDGGRVEGVWQEGVMECKARSFLLPFAIDLNERETIACVVLYVSVDEGETWKRVAARSPNGSGFPFQAPREGVYWFALQVQRKDGTKEPADPADLVPAMKVRVKVDGGIVPPREPRPGDEGGEAGK